MPLVPQEVALRFVDAACSQGHAGAEGMDNYLEDPTTTLTSTPVFGMNCKTCHIAAANGDPNLAQVRSISSVRFPPTPPTGVSPVVITMQNPLDNLCATCHADANDFSYEAGARTGVDYDASGTVDDLNVELAGLMAKLMTQIQTCCTNNSHTCTDTSAHPYRAVTGATAKLNPKALKAAFNYNFITRAEGAWAHNSSCSAQLVIDAIQDLGGDVSTLVRP